MVIEIFGIFSMDQNWFINFMYVSQACVGLGTVCPSTVIVHRYSTVFTYERYGLAGLRHSLGDCQHEDGEGEDDGDTQSDLLSGVRRHAEDKNCEGRHHHTREHYIVHVVQGFPTNPKITKNY